MANVSNAFNALLGGGEQAISAKKKKQNNKQQAAAKVQAAEAPANRAASPAAAVVEANGARPQNNSGVVDASEATAILERAAREAKSIADKCRLWKDWVRQANDRSGKGIKYKAADGSALDFKQVLLLSKALDSSIESSLVSGLTHDHQDSLASLLTAFLPGANGQALAAQLVRLAGLLVDEAPDTLGAAQRAVRGTVATLKAGTAGGDAGSGAGDAVSSWLSGIDQADKEIRKQEGLLQKLHATSGGVVTKEQLSCARTMFKACEDKLDLLQPQNLPSAKASSRTECKGLDEFKAVVNSRLKEATKLEESVNTKAASAETQRVQTLAACRREEAIVTQESNEVAGQIRTLEAQLRALRSRQAELEEKRAQLQQRSRMVLDSMGSSRGLGGVLSSSHYREEMAVVKALDELLNPNQGASSEQVELVQQSQAQAPQEYLSHGQQYLALALASLAEIPTKLNFCKQRLSHADKLAKLTTTGGHSKQKEDAEKLLAEHMKTADDIHSSALQAVTDLKQRCQEIGRSSPAFAAAAAQQLQSVDALLAQIREAHEAIQVAYHAPLVEAPPPPVQANGKGGRGQAAANGGAYKGGAGSRPASAAPVPQVAPIAAAAPPPAAPVVAPTASDPVTAAPVPSLSPAAAPVVAPRAPAPPAKQWGRVAAAPVEADSSLPTPAEAFRAAAAASSSADGFKDVPAKKNRNKREEPQQA